MFGYKKTRTTPYRPQGNSVLGRVHSTMHNMLAMYCEVAHDDWAQLLTSLAGITTSAIGLNISLHCGPPISLSTPLTRRTFARLKKRGMMWVPGPVPQIVPPHCHYNPSILAPRGHPEVILAADPRACGYAYNPPRCVSTSPF